MPPASPIADRRRDVNAPVVLAGIERVHPHADVRALLAKERWLRDEWPDLRRSSQWRRFRALAQNV